MALTSAQDGQNACGSLVGDASTFLKIKKLDIGYMGKAKQMVLFEVAAVELFAMLCKKYSLDPLADGKVSFAYSRFLGLDKDKETGKIIVDPEQAETVRLIFRLSRLRSGVFFSL